MKKLTILIIAVFTVSTLSGQKNDNRPIFIKNFGQEMKSVHFDLQNVTSEFQAKKNTQFQLKSANGLKLKLDSLVDQENYKEEYAYDENGNLLLSIYSDWDVNKWKGKNKSENVFNANGNITEIVTYVGDNYRWKELNKYEYTYDANENIVQTINYLWKSGRWLNDSKTEYSFDNNGNRIQRVSFSRVGNQWINGDKVEYVFDGSGNNTLNNYYSWEADKWINTGKLEYTYDSIGNQTVVLSSSWLNDQYVNSWKDEIAYDTEENTKLIVSSNWQSDQWVKSWKQESAYNTNGITVNYTSYNWENNQWIESQRYYSEFDDEGNRTLNIYMSWEENDWVNSFKSEYSYDNEFSYDDLVLPFSGNNDPELQLIFNHKLINLKYSYFNGAVWDVDVDYRLYYSEQNFTSLKDYNINDQIMVFPNPVTDQIFFNIKGVVGELLIDILDNQGKLVKSMEGDNDESFSIESFKSGLYFFRISANGKYYKGKFIVK